MYGHESDAADLHIQELRSVSSKSLLISADLFRASSVRDAFSSFQPAKPASQASQARPGRPASQASRASKPQASRHRCQQFFFIGAPARLLRPAQAATGRIAFWHPQHQGGQPSMPQTYQISMIWPPFQQIESWDDHFMDLGYPSKFYRVQDASFIDGSSI